MQKIIIHIGYPKTGSTWFQRKFYPYVDNYKYIHRKKFQEPFLYKSENEFELFASENFNKGNHIICEEKIINIKTDEITVEERIARLKKSFNNPLIIIFIRNQFDIIESTYTEYLKAGNSKSFNFFVDNLFRENKIRQWNYYTQILLVKEAFSNVKVFMYEDFKNSTEKFIKEYANLLNLDIDLSKTDFGIINQSINPKLVPGIKIMNKVLKVSKNKKSTSSDIYRRLYMKINSNINYNKVSVKTDLKSETREKLYDYFKTSNKKLITDFNLDIRKYNYPL